MDQSGRRPSEAAGVEVEGREVTLEVHVQPLAPGRLRMHRGSPHHFGTDPPALVRAPGLRVEEEGVVAAVPSDVHKPDEYAVGVSCRDPPEAVLPDAGPPASEGVPAVAFYRARGGTTLIQVSTASAAPSLVPYLQERGYRPTARTLVEQAVTGEVVHGTRACSYDIEISEAPTDEWFDRYWSVEATRGRGDADRAVCRHVLLAPGLLTVFAAARRGPEVVGVGQLVIEGGWGGVQCTATAQAHRRRGVARAVLNGLAEEALRLGVRHLYLAVVSNNDAAKALYESSGFRPVHKYRYFTSQPDWMHALLPNAAG